MERGNTQSAAEMMRRTLSSAGYDLTPSGLDRLEESLRCPNCHSQAGLGDEQLAHSCCYCADGGRVRVRDGVILCPQCTGQAANPTIQENPIERMRIPMRYRDTTFKTWLPDNGSPRLRCQGYAIEWPPKKPFLFLSGNKGTGKTTLGIAVLKAAQERHGVIGQFWPVTDLLSRLRATADPDRATESESDVLTQMQRIPLLVLDDWGAHKATDFAEDRLFTIIDWRYRDMKPTVVTSNADLADLDHRVKSRLADYAVSETVRFTGKDMRPEAAA